MLRLNHCKLKYIVSIFCFLAQSWALPDTLVKEGAAAVTIDVSGHEAANAYTVANSLDPAAVPLDTLRATIDLLPDEVQALVNQYALDQVNGEKILTQGSYKASVSNGAFQVVNTEDESVIFTSSPEGNTHEEAAVLKLNDDGDLELLASDGTTVLWSVANNHECPPTQLRLRDTGMLHLICSDNKIAWESGRNVYVPMTIRPDTKPCTYPHELVGPELLAEERKVNVSIAIAKKCRSENGVTESTPFATTVSGGVKAVKVTRQLCGVRGSDLIVENVENQDLCLSVAFEGAKKIIEQKVRVSNLAYSADLKDMRRAKFLNKKRTLETELNEAFMRNEVMQKLGFDSLTVASFAQVKNSRRRRKRSDDGTDIITLIKFVNPPEDDDFTEYETELATILEAGTSKFEFNKDASSLDESKECGSPAKFRHLVPEDIWEATAMHINMSASLSIGEYVHLVCPAPKKLSIDGDGFHENDDLFSVLCTIEKSFELPSPLEWPKCVKSCPAGGLQDAPEYTNLEPIQPDNTIAAGQFAQYRCKDYELDDNNENKTGVESSASEIWNILCTKGGTYQYPVADGWPTCRKRTTTSSPVIREALDVIMARNRKDLESRFKIFRWEDGDVGYVEPEIKPYLNEVTLPTLLGFFVGLSLVCFCLLDNGPCCAIFKDEFRNKKKSIRQVFKKGDKRNKKGIVRRTYASFDQLHDATREKPNIYKNTIG